MRGEHPLGTSIVEEGEGCRPSIVIYNRKWSSAAQMKPGDFNFKEILKDGSILHVSGITLSISKKARDTAIEAMRVAKEMGLKISFDFNYRKKLMSLEEAKEVYPCIAKYADIISASAWDIQTLLGFHPDETNQDKLFEDACNEFNFEYIFTRKRTIISSREQRLQAFAYTKSKKAIGSEYQFEIFDRIGAGDAFVAGYLHGLLKDEKDLSMAMKYGMANCVLEQTTLGDCSRFSEKDLEHFLLTSGLEEMER